MRVSDGVGSCLINPSTSRPRKSHQTNLMPPMRASWAFDCSKPSGRALTCYFKLERRAAGSFPHLVSTSTAVPRLQSCSTRGGAQSCHALLVGRPFAAATTLPRPQDHSAPQVQADRDTSSECPRNRLFFVDTQIQGGDCVRESGLDVIRSRRCRCLCCEASTVR